jgi:hypothetical protein
MARRAAQIGLVTSPGAAFLDSGSLRRWPTPPGDARLIFLGLERCSFLISLRRVRGGYRRPVAGRPSLFSLPRSSQEGRNSRGNRTREAD